MSINIDNYIKYVPLDENELKIKHAEFMTLVMQGLSVFNINPAGLQINNANILEIIERVEKRRVYFKIYYDLNMSEKNEAALYCFWILHLCPFFDSSDFNNDVNVKIAIHVLLSAVTYVAGKTGHKLTSISGKYLQHLVYSFKYRDISKEAIMTIIESLLV